ncbi:MAG: serine/threonine protein kinase, partial [Deltaproteobacteria bacterium]|nr:serine/threonine protein kinase [Nannocystaceae bacterium]
MTTGNATEPLELRQLVGQVISERYQVDGVIGVGGMGAVFRCRHLGLGLDVAVKVLHPHIGNDAECGARFAREAHSASRLDHPNCVRVLDFGNFQDDGGRVAKYLCMELLCGFELARLLDEPLPTGQALALVRQMLDGLAHAHERGVVHRDVKPRNVVIVAGSRGEDVVKLVDFGTAKILTGEGAAERMTRQGTVCGTPNYMSPEQVVGEPIDGRADLYATGVLLHRMLCGRLPFAAEDPARVMQMHLLDPPPPLPRRLPERLRAFGAQLLAKNRERRHRTAAAARDELDAIIAARPPEPLEGRERADASTALHAGTAPSTRARRRISIR